LAHRCVPCIMKARGDRKVPLQAISSGVCLDFALPGTTISRTEFGIFSSFDRREPALLYRSRSNWRKRRKRLKQGKSLVYVRCVLFRLALHFLSRKLYFSSELRRKIWCKRIFWDY